MGESAQKPILIVGAGICGCTAAYELSKRGFKVILIEKSPSIGGLAKTFRYGDFLFDIGPHRFFSNEQSILAYVQDVIGKEYVLIPRVSDVYFLNKYYSWPLKPAVLLNLPLSITVKSAQNLLSMAFTRRSYEIETFEEYILRNYGPTLYNSFFKDYTEKFLGVCPKELHYLWAHEGMKKTVIDERLASRNLIEILKSFLCFKPAHTEFIYPRHGGIGSFCDTLARKIKENGGEVCTHTAITRLKFSAHEVTEVLLQDNRTIEPSKIIWTGALEDVANLLGVSCNGLEYLSLLLFNLELNTAVQRSFQWCYYGSKEIVFSRVTNPSFFNSDLAPRNKSSLCVEVTCKEGSRNWGDPHQLIPQVLDHLVKVKLLRSRNEVDAVHIEKVSHAYPIYTIHYDKKLGEIKNLLGKKHNLVLAGRTGLFWYNNMDDSIRNALEVANTIIEEEREE